MVGACSYLVSEHRLSFVALTLWFGEFYFSLLGLSLQEGSYVYDVCVSTSFAR